MLRSRVKPAVTKTTGKKDGQGEDENLALAKGFLAD